MDPSATSSDGSGLRTSRRVFLGGMTVTGVLGSSVRVGADNGEEAALGFGEGEFGEAGFGGGPAVEFDVTVTLDGPEEATVDEHTEVTVTAENDGGDVPEDVQFVFTFDRVDEIEREDLDVESRASNDAGWEPLELSDGDEGLATIHPEDGFLLSGGQQRTSDLRITFREADEYTIGVSVTGVDAGEAYASTALAVDVEPEEEVIEDVELPIAIKPGGDDRSAPINPNARGRTPVAILTTDEFAPVEELVVDSLRFGPPRVVDGGDGAGADHHTEEDVDDDGTLDLKVHFDSAETGFGEGDEYGKLVGETHDGTPVAGTAEIRIVGGGGGGGRGRGRGNQ